MDILYQHEVLGHWVGAFKFNSMPQNVSAALWLLNTVYTNLLRLMCFQFIYFTDKHYKADSNTGQWACQPQARIPYISIVFCFNDGTNHESDVSVGLVLRINGFLLLHTWQVE